MVGFLFCDISTGRSNIIPAEDDRNRYLEPCEISVCMCGAFVRVNTVGKLPTYHKEVTPVHKSQRNLMQLGHCFVCTHGQIHH